LALQSILHQHLPIAALTYQLLIQSSKRVYRENDSFSLVQLSTICAVADVVPASPSTESPISDLVLALMSVGNVGATSSPS
jgi:hypothetical protein